MKGNGTTMIKQQLIEENNRLKEALKQIIKLTSVIPDPNIPDDMIYYNPSDKTGFYAYRMGTICAIAEMELNLPE